MEPFLCSVQSNHDITGYIKPSGHHKIAAFADDLIFYVTDLSTTLPNILRVLRTHGELSYFEINLAKLAALNMRFVLETCNVLSP